jgi:hypothetical protein
MKFMLASLIALTLFSFQDAVKPSKGTIKSNLKLA